MAVSISGFVNSQSPAQSQIASSGSGTSLAGDLASGQSSLDTSFQSFLTLLTTQLQNQDPTSPMDPNSFTTELVQMTGVQQQLLTNELLQELTNSASADVGLIGKTVTAASSITNLTNSQATWNYSLASAASSGTFTVTNSTGQTVFSGALQGLSAGSNTFSWNGQGNDGAQQPDGVYKLTINASGSDGSQIQSSISVSGVVSSIQNSSNGTALVTIGNTAVPISSVTNVAETPDSSGDSSSSNNSTN